MSEDQGQGSASASTLLQQPDTWRLGPLTFTSRLLVGTGRYASVAQTRAAIDASGAEIVTVSVRRVDLSGGPAVLDAVDRDRYTLLPNTAGCYTAEDAVRTAMLARELGMGDLVKLEVIGDERTLYPDAEGLLAAARALVKEGFMVMPYCTDDLVLCRKLEDAGCVTVMPLGAPIGSGLGIRNPHNIGLIVEQAGVPVVVDAGVGTASDAALAMELGCAAVLMNTAIAGAKDPVAMARAMRLGIEGGRLAWRAGRIERRAHASASSPMSGLIA